MTDHSALIERLEAHDGSHDRGCDGRNYACTCGDDDKGEALLKEAAAALRDQQDRREGIEEDLFQAVSVAYHRGAVEWARRNYPQWFAWIEEGRACLPSAPNQAKPEN